MWVFVEYCVVRLQLLSKDVDWSMALIAHEVIIQCKGRCLLWLHPTSEIKAGNFFKKNSFIYLLIYFSMDLSTLR